MQFMIYGSYGYTGDLIVAQAVQAGLKPLLAGRNKVKLRRQAAKFGLDYRAFALDNQAALEAVLLEVEAVLNCAGPFVLTFEAMVKACIRTRRHYVDISGEIEAFEVLAAMDTEARQAGIMILPGAGFDVVPSDCLIAYAASKMAAAREVILYIKSVGSGISRGTARSGIENSHRQGRIRQDGKIIHVPNLWDIQQVDFGRGKTEVVSVGWGDVSTAYHSTGIPNIKVYMSFPKVMIRLMRVSGWFGKLGYSRASKNLIKWLIGVLLPPGPTPAQNKSGFALLMAEVNDGRNCVRVKLQTPEAYLLTALSAVDIIKRILGNDYKIGFQTPSLAYGADLILGFPGVKREAE